MGQLLGVAAPSPAPIAEPEPQAIAPRDEGLLQTLIAEANRLYQEQPLVLLMYLSLVFMYLQLMQQQKHQGKCMTALVEQLESHGAVAKAADDNDTDHHRIGAHRVNSDLLGTNLPQLTDDELDMHLQGVQPVMHEPPGAIFKNNVAVLRSINRETKRLQLYRGQAPGKFDRVWTSRPHDIAPGPVDLHCEMFDVADLVNQYKDVTGIQIPGDAVAMFNETWRAHLRSIFSDLPGGEDELKEFLDTGKSCGYPMRLQIMALPPHTWFRCHAHPNIEFEHTLAGTLREVRLAHMHMKKGSFRDVRGRPIPPGTPSGPYGPNLVELKEKLHLDWSEEVVPAGDYLGNLPGSVHQSFTGADGAVLLLLWSGCHANIRPSRCRGVTPKLRPEAGWENDPDKDLPERTPSCMLSNALAE
eukprot:TRINITY_DN55028_c0_g2_i3.p1 TRINITY_DN55028_c0_g2~~TRINITY_DN55028_c0_g2_i3.p1  ORF type:complete len:414 (-),score=62.98 TRINITY_DN55028_c0_g2_i3:149-1390(-)